MTDRSRRRWFPLRTFLLDYERRNAPGGPAAQRGAEAAAQTRRRRTRPVTLARSAADETPTPAPRPPKRP